MAQESKQIIVISSAHNGYRRAGVALQQGENQLDASQFSDAQIKMLQADPRLSVAVSEVADTPVADISPQGGVVADDVSGSVTPAQDLREAIMLLDPSNTDHFTSSGKPQVDALEKLMQAPVSAAERDEAWEAFKDSQAEGE